MASERPRPWRALRRHVLIVGLVSVAVLFVLAVAIEGMLWMQYARPRAGATPPARALPATDTDRPIEIGAAGVDAVGPRDTEGTP